MKTTKTNSRSRKSASIGKTRWAAYAAAGAATALASSHTAEAAIHYSGPVWVKFPPYRDGIHTFPLDQVGDSLVFQRLEVGTEFGRPDVDYFRIDGIASIAFRAAGATISSYTNYVAKLGSGEPVSRGFFQTRHLFNNGAPMVFGGFSEGYAPWRKRGTGYVGFRFNNGAGLQYGWVRVKMGGRPEHPFTVVSYAYADPGEPILAGQTSSDQQWPYQGSLGGLALGAVGLLAWRKSRSPTAR